MAGKVNKKLFLIIILLCAMNMPYKAYAEKSDYEKLPNIILITIAGVRNQDTIDDKTHQYIPKLWGNIFKKGTLYTNLINLSNAFHMPTVESINTGLIYPYYTQEEAIRAPSIFQLVGEKYAPPLEKMWSIGCWDKGGNASLASYQKNLKHPYPAELINNPRGVPELLKGLLTVKEENFLKRYLVDNITLLQWDSLGRVYYEFLLKIMSHYKPKLIHYILSDAESAHYSTYARYVLSIKNLDERLYDLFQRVESDPFYKDNTYIIIAVDCGRGQYYMTHNDNSVTKQVWMFVYGPDVKRNEVIKREVSHLDIFRTVAHIMDVKDNNTTGKDIE